MPVSVNIKGRITSQQLPPEAGRVKPLSKPAKPAPASVPAPAKIEESKEAKPSSPRKLFSLRKSKRQRD